MRSVWDDSDAKWWFSVLDVVAVLNEENDYQRVRNYWKYLKAKLKKENNQLGSATTQLVGIVSNASAVQQTPKCPEFTAEAIRVINSTPRWIPGMHDG